jgi:hypothetical protein
MFFPKKQRLGVKANIFPFGPRPPNWKGTGASWDFMARFLFSKRKTRIPAEKNADR